MRVTHLGSTRVALDIGGANLKAAHDAGPSICVPFELWRKPEGLRDAIHRLLASLPAFDSLLLTMTGELCDCFETRKAGVSFILSAVFGASKSIPTSVWCVDSRFRTPIEIIDEPLLAASSNWIGLAKVAARIAENGPGLLVDVGSTTTDLVPMAGGKPRHRGRTDLERLRSGELVYAGVRRTPLAAIASSLRFRSESIGLCAERFAETLDVYLTLGSIPPDPADLGTADGRPATRDAARSRLARMVGEDRDGFNNDDAEDLARSADSALLDRLELSARAACHATIGHPIHAVVSGSGEFLATRLARRLVGPAGRVLSLSELWGPAGSEAACARALLELTRTVVPIDSPRGGEN